MENSKFELTADIIEIMETQTYNKGFKKREFVVETSGKYPQKILFQTVQDKVDMLDSFSIGDTISISFDIKGREWKDRYFNSLEAWRIIMEKRATDKDYEDDSDIFEDSDLFPEKLQNTNIQSFTSELDDDDDLPF